MKRKLEGIFSLLLGTVIWGGAFVAQSAGMERIGPFTFQAVRCALAVLALIAFTALMEMKNLDGWHKRWLDKKLWRTGLLCGLPLFVATALQQVALVYTDNPGKAGFITAMYIVMVPLLGILLKRKPPVTALIGVVLAVAGMYALCCVGVSTINIGDIMLLGCALAFAVQITLVDRMAMELDSLRLNAIQALVVTVISTVFMFAVETPKGGDILSAWLPLSYAGVLSMGAGYSLQIIGQKRLEPTAATMIMSLESVFAVVFSALLLHKGLSASESFGCVLVFVAVILSQLPEKK